MTNADVLRHVRKETRVSERFGGGCICVKLRQYCRNEAQITSLKRWISKQLRGVLTYEEWLQRKGYNVLWNNEECSERIKAGRLAWLDWMIAECERNGW